MNTYPKLTENLCDGLIAYHTGKHKDLELWACASGNYEVRSYDPKTHENRLIGRYVHQATAMRSFNTLKPQFGYRNRRGEAIGQAALTACLTALLAAALWLSFGALGAKAEPVKAAYAGQPATLSQASGKVWRIWTGRAFKTIRADQHPSGASAEFARRFMTWEVSDCPDAKGCDAYAKRLGLDLSYLDLNEVQLSERCSRNEAQACDWLKMMRWNRWLRASHRRVKNPF